MEQRNFHNTTATALLGLALLVSCQADSEPKFRVEQVREYASALYNRELYHQAIDQYNYCLDSYNLDATEEANINYTIAKIYFERMRDYENALTYYLKIKEFYPESDLLDEVNKRMVECLERLQRSADAQQVLEETALLDPSRAHTKRPGAVVAKIGKRPITTGDLEFQISQLPPFMRPQLNDKSKKAAFLKQYIATELLYDTARRKGLDHDMEVVEAIFQAKKKIMVQKLLEEEISEEVNVRESDVELYYKANRDKYAEKNAEGKVTHVKPLDEVRARVMQDLIKEKQREAYDRLVQRIMRAEAVEIYEDKL